MSFPTTPKTRISLAKKSDHKSSAQASAPVSRVDSLALVIARNAFYKTNFRKVTFIVLGQLLAVFVLGAVVYRLFEFTASLDYYFPVQTDNTIIAERPLYEPVYSDAEIINWAEEAVTHTMTFGYYDYLMRWQSSRAYFTLTGWSTFTKAMKEIKLLNTIGVSTKDDPAAPGSVQQVVVARVHPGSRPKISQQGVSPYGYIWDVTMPIDVTFYDKTRQSRFSWKVDLRIIRMPTRESRYGKGIVQLIAEQAK